MLPNCHSCVLKRLETIDKNTLSNFWQQGNPLYWRTSYLIIIHVTQLNYEINHSTMYAHLKSFSQLIFSLKTINIRHCSFLFLTGKKVYKTSMAHISASSKYHYTMRKSLHKLLFEFTWWFRQRFL